MGQFYAFRSSPTPTAITHDQLVATALDWLRQTKGYKVVIPELSSYTNERPDVVGWKNNVSAIVECKVSRSDFLADRKKPHRACPAHGIGNYRYYLCPPKLIKPDDLPERWGLLYAGDDGIQQVVDAKIHLLDEVNLIAERMMLYSLCRRAERRGLLKYGLAQKWGGLPNGSAIVRNARAILSRLTSDEKSEQIRRLVTDFESNADDGT